MQSASSWSSRHCFFYMSELRNGPHRIMTGLTSTRCWKNLTAVQPTVLTEECGPVTSFVVKFAVDSLLEGDGFGGDASQQDAIGRHSKGGNKYLRKLLIHGARAVISAHRLSASRQALV